MFVSKHARKRLKKRFGAKHQLVPLAEEAFSSGLKLDEASGSLRRFMDRVRKVRDTVPVAWKGLVWLAQGSTLVTVMILPHQILRSYVRQIERKQSAQSRGLLG